MDVVSVHRADVLALSTQVEAFYKRGTRIKIYHGNTNSTRSQKFDPQKTIDISRLSRILEVNVQEGYALVEPNVPMDMLVNATLQYGLIPPVVMEFPGITAGGGIQGGAGESSSFKDGLFHENCIEYEIILANGEIVTTSRKERPDLFWGTACSYGTLGLITLVKLRLIPASTYVKLTYERVGSFEEMVLVIQKAARANVDFVDGIMFSKKRGVVMTGMRTNDRISHVTKFLRARDEWFYIHANKIIEHHQTYEEMIPLKDYLFRYDRGGFWVGMYGFRRGSIPFNRLTRFLFNPFLKTRELYDIVQATNTSQQYIVQDISLPEKNALSFLEFVDTEIGCYPLWICPLKPDAHTPLSPAHIQTEMVINVGVWGELSSRKRDYASLYELNRKLEDVTEKLGGRKVLYAHAYYPKNQFWNIYGERWYVELRDRYQASRTFPDVYEKVFVAERYRPAVRKGLGRLALRKIFQKPKAVFLRILRGLSALARA